ncbi:MAG: hypothetical protein HAW62_05350 [Endozoicomonadaceae bacterium]|nr:hypothetical protein [Endozoicomonadaceae bacterium]
MIDQFIKLCQKNIHEKSDQFALIQTLIPHFQDFIKQADQWLDYTVLEYNSDGCMRNILCSEDNLGLFVMTWSSSKSSPVHDHADTWGIMSVLEGCLCEEEYYFKSPLQDDRLHNDLILKKRKLTYLIEGSMTAFIPQPESYTHCMKNMTEKPGLSVHLYGSALKKYYLYDEITSKRELYVV